MSEDHTVPFGETSSAPQFSGLLNCVLWHLRHKNVSYDQAQDACFLYKDIEVFGIGSTLTCLLTAVFTIVNNIVVLRRVSATRDPAYFSIANLAFSDLVSGLGLLGYTTSVLRHSTHHRVMQSLTFLMFSQAMSASGLTLMSINSYLAINHPIFVFVYAEDLNHYTRVAVVSWWFVHSLLFSLPIIMGWNCLDEPTQNCFGLFHSSFVTAVATMIGSLAIIVAMTNFSAFTAIRNRQRRRRLGEDEPQEASEEFDHRARTVMIHAVVAFVSWFLPRVVVVTACHFDVDDCPMVEEPGVLAVLMVFNSAINPIASLTRTPALGPGMSLDCPCIQRVLDTLMSRSRAHPHPPQDEPPVHEIGAHLDGGPAASGSGQDIQDGHVARQGQQEFELRRRVSQPGLVNILS